ncbi:DUF998 domain-containing protein [Fructilactobacillus frigidiflavus]|uniref:DUF998 domain-containing protein n=1 Tax=Fructilactobacillus frigidiflavus TaxID=3242688 RepID=UPI00375663D0
MAKQNYHIEIPAQVVKQIKLKPNEKLDLKIENNAIRLEKQANTEDTGWDVSYWWSLIPALVTSVIFFMFFTLRKITNVKFTGSYSIATATIILGMFSGLILFSIFFIKARNQSVNAIYRNLYWRNFPTIILSFTAILLFGLLGIFWILARVFMGATFGIYTATLMFLVFQLIINTVMILLAQNITPTMLVDVFVITIFGGVMISMLSNSNLQWWKHNISFLGTNKAVDSWQFNLTFIFAALLMIALIDYLFVSIKPLHRPLLQTQILRFLLTMMAINALCVGLIANNRQIPWMHLWHDICAWSMALDVIILIGGIKWLWPGISQNFLKISNTLGGLILLASFLFKGAHYFSLTAYEIFASALAFSWIMMLFQYILKQINWGTHEFVVEVKQD